MILLEKVIREVTKKKVSDSQKGIRTFLLDFSTARDANMNFLKHASFEPQEFFPFMRIFTPRRSGESIDWEATYKDFREELKRNQDIELLGYQTSVIRDVVGFVVTGLSDADPDSVKVMKASQNILITYSKSEQPSFINFSLALIMANDPRYDSYIRFRSDYLKYFKSSKIYNKSLVFLGVANMLYDLRIINLSYSFQGVNLVSVTGSAFVRSKIAMHWSGCNSKSRGDDTCLESKGITFRFL